MKSKFESRLRAKDIGIKIDIIPTGESNSICDSPDLKIGHVTLMQGDGNTVNAMSINDLADLLQKSLNYNCE